MGLSFGKIIDCSYPDGFAQVEECTFLNEAGSPRPESAESSAVCAECEDDGGFLCGHI